MGLTERVNIYATMLWFALLSIVLWRARADGRQGSPGAKPGILLAGRSARRCTRMS